MNAENINSNFLSIADKKKAELALDELVKARDVLISAGFEPIMREIQHFKAHRAVRAEPLSFHIKTLVEWNQQTQIARDAFRKELERLEYTPEQLRKLFDDEKEAVERKQKS